MKFGILPLSEHKLSYSLHPLFSGELALPLLHISLPTGYDQRSDAGLSEDLLPTHIFVKVCDDFSPMELLRFRDGILAC